MQIERASEEMYGRVGHRSLLTTRGASYNNTSNTFVYAPKATSGNKALGRLESCLDRVDWVEEQVNGRASNTTGLG